METILKIFYNTKNQPLHLREIARRINLSEGPASRHLNRLAKQGILKFRREANLKKFYLSDPSSIFPMFDFEKVNNLPVIRRNALKYYLNSIKQKPVFIIVFGSTAKGTYKESSDLDLLEITNNKTDTASAIKTVQAQTSVRISRFQMTFNEFKKELKLKQDHVVQSALSTGFPVYNHKYFYEIIYERA